jgi:trans-aconitate methyltransferase
MAERVRDQKVVHVGCLGGNTQSMLISHRFFEATAREIHGLDNNKQLLRAARNTGAKNLHFCDVMNLEQLNACAVVFGKFEAAILSHILEHVMDTGVFLENVQGLLEPGGRVHVCVPNESSPTFMGMRSTGKNPPHPDHVDWYCRKTMGQTLRRAGMKVKDTKWFNDPRDRRWAQTFGLKWADWMGFQLYMEAEVQR